MDLTLAQVLDATGARPINVAAADRQTVISGWSIDSRTVTPGSLFFALRGDVHDGHVFVPTALQQGAVAAVVSELPAPANGMLLQVPDTLRALQQVAHLARKEWGKNVVAVTGSAGKTTTKDIIASFLGVSLRVGKTAGNLNNHIGLPLSLLRLPADADVAVLELGMNHAGEIRDLARLAEPQIGVVTNVGYAHVEAFDSIEGVAAAKRELIEALPASGVAVLNADDERVLAFRHSHGGRTVTYGLAEHADLRAVQIEGGPGGTDFTVHGVRFRMALTGRHSLSNVLAGLAVADLFQISLEQLVGAVADLRPSKMRGERTVRNGITILNDSYNSNPEAARGMIDVLLAEPAQRRIAVLGEMLELGRMAEQLHRDLGAYVASSGIDVLVGVGGASRFMVEQAGNAGVANHKIFFFNDAEQAGAFLPGFVRRGDAILFKASRGTHIETAIARMEE